MQPPKETTLRQLLRPHSLRPEDALGDAPQRSLRMVCRRSAVVCASPQTGRPGYVQAAAPHHLLPPLSFAASPRARGCRTQRQARVAQPGRRGRLRAPQALVESAHGAAGQLQRARAHRRHRRALVQLHAALLRARFLACRGRPCQAARPCAPDSWPGTPSTPPVPARCRSQPRNGTTASGLMLVEVRF